MQSPTTTVSLTIANWVLHGQLMGFKVDTWPHCQGPSTNYPLLTVTMLMTVFAHVLVLAGPRFTARPLSLYHFPSHFRFSFYGILLGAATLFLGQRAFRQFMRRKQQQRYQAHLRQSGSSAQLFSSRNSLGSAERAISSDYSFSVKAICVKLRRLIQGSTQVVPLSSQVAAATPLATRKSTASGSAQLSSVRSLPAWTAGSV